MKGLHSRFRGLYGILFAFGLILVIFGISLDAGGVLSGLRAIITTKDVLITDYMEIGGVGAAFVNSGLLALIAVTLLFLCGDPANGYTISTVGLMAGFGLFGKNIANVWPIIIGTFIYAKARRERFATYVSVGLLATTLSPLLSFLYLYDPHDPVCVIASLLLGLLIGFIIPPIAAHTYNLLNGMNLYNMGFAAGVLAMVIVPVIISFGPTPSPESYWHTGSNTVFLIFLYILCALCIAAAFLLDRRVLKTYWALLKTSGRAPSDYLRMFGSAATLISMGVNGVIATSYILIIGGDLNGPTIGGIFTVMCFSSYGKHAFNILPVMCGVVIGGLIKQWSLTDPSIQIAALFCTTLAPISGYFGWPFGILAGFLHSSVALRAGLALEGVNLYNNGFSGGLVSLALYPVITAIFRRRMPTLRKSDYLANFEEDENVPIPEKVSEPPEEPRPFSYTDSE